MSLFSLVKASERVGVVIDVGSGSVLVAIVVSNPTEKKPTIVWSHREQAPLRTIESLEQSAKSVMTSLINALLKFDSEGRRALRDFNQHTTIDEVQCCICAPWAYTVTKSITYNQDTPFEITKTLLESLIESAEKNTQAELAKNEAVSELGLTIITRSTLDTLANGYRVAAGVAGEATELSISQVTVLTEQYLVEHLSDLRHKMFSDKPLHKLSYMLALYSVTEELFDDSGDFCLVDITYEATEIGVVRDGTLTYSTHIPFGSFSLAREIAHATSLPLLQAFNSLHEADPTFFMEQLPKSQRVEVEAIYESYTQRLRDLFVETGDDLSIPKRMYVHTEKQLEPLFTDLLTKAIQSLLKAPAHIKPISSLLTDMVEVENKEQNADTAMLVAAKFFHTQNVRRHFEYL
jgi:cell division ATPase FtsA